MQGRIQEYLEGGGGGGGGGQLYSVRHIHTDKRVLNADGIPHLPLCLTVSNELIINCYAKNRIPFEILGQWFDGC